MFAIAVMIKVLVFVFCVAFAVCVPLFLILGVYIVPYSWWIAGQNAIGKYQETKKENGLSVLKNATKLYKAWIFHQEPNF